MPFLLFAALFLLAPVWLLIQGSLQDNTGALTLQNYQDLTRPDIVLAFRTSIEISLVTAILGGTLRLPARLRRHPRRAAALPAGSLMTFSGVASNFAGIPLALAFIFTLGQLGLVTVLLKTLRHRHLGQTGSACTPSSASRSSTSTSSSRSWS